MSAKKQAGLARAYSYVRFSTPEQAAGDSLRRQTQGAEDYAKRNGLDLDAELTFRDLGKSAFKGKNAETGALRAFLDAIEDGLVKPGSVLIVESLDRISRNVARKAVRVLEEIVESGVDVVTLHDGKRYDKAALDGFDFIMAALIAMRGHEESATKSKRLREAWIGKRSRVSNGHALTSLAPGWIAATKGAKPKLIPERAKVVRQIFALFLAGQGKESIARTLNAEKVPTFGKRRRPRKDSAAPVGASRWHKSYILKVLDNPACVGTFTPHEMRDGERVPLEPVRDYFPAAIDGETWTRAQALLTTSKRNKSRVGETMNLLAGLARCPKCGGTMTRVFKGDRKKAGAPKLVCVASKSGADYVRCEYRAVPLNLLEECLTRHARVFAASCPARDPQLTAEIEQGDALLHDKGTELNAVLEAVKANPNSKTLNAEMNRLETECDTLKASLEEMRERAAQSESKLVARRAERLTKALTAKPLDRAACNAALRECFSRAVVDYAKGDLRLVWRHTESDLTLDYEWHADLGPAPAAVLDSASPERSR